ncbi:MAG: DUF1127 domain-containing protein [Rhodobacteraceae bacterium]|nr:DUF1127 domain-containing protein [Paracoccaceae bacterium]
MAYATASRPIVAGLRDRLSTLVADLREANARRRVYRQTLGELQGLSNRELADLGICRSMITRIALEAAYGPDVR